MKSLTSFLIIVLVILSSCKGKKSGEEVSEKMDTLKVNSDRIVNTIGETLIPNAKKAVAEWKEYNDVDEFLLQYYSISTSEALTNAKELSELTQYMKDTIRVEKLKELNVVARFNVLHNEALRLADMANIPSISDEEVKEEVSNIIELYSALNSKINTIYKAEELQKALDVDTEKPIELEEQQVLPVYRKPSKTGISSRRTPE